jgi:uncharacterized protein (UPF0303 family)
MNDSNSLDALLAEERELQLPSFGNDVAWTLGSYIHQRAKAGSLPIAIEVSRNGQQLFFAALPGATPDNAEWIRRKRAVVQRFHHSSFYMSVERRMRPRTIVVVLPSLNDDLSFCQTVKDLQLQASVL